MPAPKQATYPYYGLGFLVNLLRCPVVFVRGEWVPDVDFNRIENEMAIVVPLKPAVLTGNEIKFLRRHHGLTLNQLADKLQLTRQAIMKWEKTGDSPAKLEGPAEITLRLFFLRSSGVDCNLFERAFDKILEHKKDEDFSYRRPMDRKYSRQQVLISMLS